MDDGRETSVQSYIFLILICHSIEDYLLNIHQSIIDIISKILQFFLKKSISLKDFYILSKIENRQNFSFLILRTKDCISYKRRCSFMIKRDEYVSQSIAPF